MDDYRTNEYEPKFENIKGKKDEVINLIRKKHKTCIDIYRLVRENSGEYKVPFMAVYNNKCSYCGLSTELVPMRDYFEVDHFINKKSEIFSSEAEAGQISNIVLACHNCNHNKLGYEIPPGIRALVFPDDEEIKKVFVRDENYYIVISDEYKDNCEIKEFYENLRLCEESKRLDYILMKLMKMQERATDKEKYMELGKSIEDFKKKRTMV